MSELSPVIVSHSSCQDGMCSAHVFKQRYPEAEIHFSQYNQDPPVVTNRDLIIVDFSYPKNIMETLIIQAKSVVILDHHQTSAEALTDLQGATVIFDNNRSGAKLAWDYCYPGEDSPWYVNYVCDRDLWRFELKDSKPINAAMQSYPMSYGQFDIYASFNQDQIDNLANEGRLLLKKDEQTVRSHVSKAYEVRILGHKVLCCNATTLISEIGEKLCQDRPFSVTYFDSKDKRHWSFRSSKTGEDVSKIAESFGGGGHVHSSACNRPINEMIFDVK